MLFGQQRAAKHCISPLRTLFQARMMAKWLTPQFKNSSKRNATLPLLGTQGVLGYSDHKALSRCWRNASIVSENVYRVYTDICSLQKALTENSTTCLKHIRKLLLSTAAACSAFFQHCNVARQYLIIRYYKISQHVTIAWVTQIDFKDF